MRGGRIQANGQGNKKGGGAEGGGTRGGKTEKRNGELKSGRGGRDKGLLSRKAG